MNTYKRNTENEDKVKNNLNFGTTTDEIQVFFSEEMEHIFTQLIGFAINSI
jgi:hypothetical protein